MVEVQELGAGIGAAYEEVAVLYANGNAREAEALLDAVLASEIQGGAGRRAVDDAARPVQAHRSA